MKNLNKKGVSLAELLAVVVIMGIIAAIAIPLVGNVIETSKKKAHLGDLTTIAEAARTYCIAEGKDGTGICGGTPTDPTDVLQKYISKTIDSIGTITVQKSGEKYLVSSNNDNSKYSTSGVAIDPTEENALDKIAKKSASELSSENNKKAVDLYLVNLGKILAAVDAGSTNGDLQTVDLGAATEGVISSSQGNISTNKRNVLVLAATNITKINSEITPEINQFTEVWAVKNSIDSKVYASATCKNGYKNTNYICIEDLKENKYIEITK